jgi:hypothetical protein
MRPREPEIPADVIRALSPARKLEYMVSGAVAAILCGEPRLTNDIGVVAALESTARLPKYRIKVEARTDWKTSRPTDHRYPGGSLTALRRQEAG